ncbi:hypothetical protein RHSIM_Rhsim02G0182100 [Rhododendron simsii]|uniref:Sulfite exporter TauE/SafE family protein n=1 Tax=Rhododendron simsii TaxID=118357 RepID=A0A834HC84_RHOSS|nr:hypothetical protein RHSIM_Rhsim02G0182100 [Rhododendron simsii]
MAEIGAKRRVLRWISMVSWSVLVASMLASAERALKLQQASTETPAVEASGSDYLSQFVNFLWQSDRSSGYRHVWPELKFDFRIVLGTIIGFFGAAFGSVGGVGGGGIFVPMLTLIIGFDAKSATAISKCKDRHIHFIILLVIALGISEICITLPLCLWSGMIMGAAGSTVYYNLKLRHPTIDMPIIDYDLALLVQPMLMLGISIGVAFNVIFADWMVTVLLIVLFVGTSTKAFFRGVDTWKKETIMKKEAAKRLETTANGQEGAEYKPLPGGPSNDTQKETKDIEASILKQLFELQISLKYNNYATTCSMAYWVLNLLQIPVSVGVTLYEAINLYKGRRVIASKGDDGTNWKVHQLLLYCASGVLAGIVGGLLGLGGGFIMGPLFLELGVPPQVSSATATFAMTFSSSMSVVEYYLLKRFPVPYALYFMAVATVAAFIGQHVVRKLIIILGRASLIIFILAFMIFVSAISLGGVGISNMIGKIERHEYMGFENLCKAA